MIRRIVILSALTASAAWLASGWAGLDAKTTLSSASKAIGADSLKSLEFSGSGYDFVIGQNVSPAAPWPRFTDKTYTRVVSFDPWATRMQRVRNQAENPPRGGGQQPIIGDQNQVQTASGTAAADSMKP